MLIPSAVIAKPIGGDLPPVENAMVNGELIRTLGAGSRNVPNGVSKLVIEIWGGGTGGQGYFDEWGDPEFPTDPEYCMGQGGGNGGFIGVKEIPVEAGQTFDFYIGAGSEGQPANSYGSNKTAEGSTIYASGAFNTPLTAFGGRIYGNGSSNMPETGFVTHYSDAYPYSGAKDGILVIGLDSSSVDTYPEYPYTGRGGNGNYTEEGYEFSVGNGIDTVYWTVAPTPEDNLNAGTSSAAPLDATKVGGGGGGSGTLPSAGGNGAGGGIRFSWA